MATKKTVGNLLEARNLKKRYPTSGTASSICLPEDDALWLPSRILAINDQLGGGIAYGHILELFGEENVGKTLLAMDFGYVAQALGGIVLWADAESTFNGPWAQKNGLDLEQIQLLPTENRIEVISDWIADMVVYYRSILTKNEPILLVVDSLAALETQLNLETSQVDRKAEMGNRAKAIDMMLRSRNGLFHKYGITVIFVNQLRKKIGATQFEDPDTTPGGQAMRFYASLRMAIYGGKLIKDKSDKRIGRLVYVRLKKTKLSMPKDNIKADVYFKKTGNKIGYSKYAGFIDVLVERGVILRKKARFYFKDKMIANGEDAMMKVLEEDDELRRKLIKRSGVLTISKMQEKLDTTKKNLYPVKSKKSQSEDDEE